MNFSLVERETRSAQDLPWGGGEAGGGGEEVALHSITPARAWVAAEAPVVWWGGEGVLRSVSWLRYGCEYGCEYVL